MLHIAPCVIQSIPVVAGTSRAVRRAQHGDRRARSYVGGKTAEFAGSDQNRVTFTIQRRGSCQLDGRADEIPTVGQENFIVGVDRLLECPTGSEQNHHRLI